MSGRDGAIDQLADDAGILSGYLDQLRRPVETSADAKRAVLGALGFDLSSESSVRDALDARRRAVSLAPRVITLRAGMPDGLALSEGAAGRRVQWTLQHESGHIKDGATTDGRLDLGSVPLGYHRLSLQAGSHSSTSLVVCAPETCWRPAIFSTQARGWGVTAQIYGLRDEQSLGIGTYDQAGTLAAAAGEKGASFLGLSPVHALFSADPGKYSPYSPSSRLFLQTNLIDARRLEGAAGVAVRRVLETPEMAATAARLAAGSLVDYWAVARLQRALFEAAFAAEDAQNDPAFLAFRRAGGDSLQRHACFEALSDHFAAQGAMWSGAWPQAYRTASSPEVQAFGREHQRQVTFHAWLQWIADAQFGDANARAKTAGMEIGFYRDCAVGPDRSGSEVWSHPERFGLELSVGAPPDPLGPAGQDWGVPPLHPVMLEHDELKGFRELVTANMRHAGALRIDHAFQLQRLFLKPTRGAATLGAYVRYPMQALLAVLKLESARAQCMVIAEDLGTAPEGFSTEIMASGLLSYRLLSFEREADGRFVPPQAYPQDALAAVTTHDLPTFAGWWRGLDVDLRECFGVFDAATSTQQRVDRTRDTSQFIDALGETHIPHAGDVRHLGEGAMRYLARSAASLLALQVEDISNDVQQANLPGLAEGPPNWRRRMVETLESFNAKGGHLERASHLMAKEDRGLRNGSNLKSAPPRATYRLQFNKDFTFAHATKILPYLARLGISHVYASPIQVAETGSTHGYDVVDHTRINPELGGAEAFRTFSDALRQHDLHLVVDIVPNHMGIAAANNPWWQSVLEFGRASPHAAAFDIDWERAGHDGKVLLPVLGQSVGDALRAGELGVAFEPDAGGLVVTYADRRFPIRPEDVAALLADVGVTYLAVGGTLDILADASSDHDTVVAAKRKLLDLHRSRSDVRTAIDAAVARLSTTASLAALLARQHYRLAFWRLAASDLNYRRFFEISTLAGLRIEDAQVFEASHKLIFDLIDEGRIQGLRIDHIDGLSDPVQYLERLQARVGPNFYIVVEKILEPGETLRLWPIAGTTGYEVLNDLDGLFVEQGSEHAFELAYRANTGDDESYASQLSKAKHELLTNSFGSEVDGLLALAARIARDTAADADMANAWLRQALVELLAAFPVYRTYVDADGPSGADTDIIAQASKAATQTAPPHLASSIAWVAALLQESHGVHASVATFQRRFQQLTGPVMAKSLEDTLFYRYGSWIVLNEVGGDPGHFGCAIDAFHERASARRANWPHNLVATATHDTKRGEDARARLVALTYRPQLWDALLELWTAHLPEGPDARDGYMLLQAIVGSWPEGGRQDAAAWESYIERACAFALKSMREAKRRSSWSDPDTAYEDATRAALEAVLRETSFLRAFQPAVEPVIAAGARLSLARLVVKMTIPGVPDFYQGTETWDLSFVDPDNRRPVDYEALKTSFAQTEGLAVVDPAAPSAKQVIMHLLLKDRRAYPDHYAGGGYEPLAMPAECVAFQRDWQDDSLIVIAARDPFETAPAAEFALPAGEWRNLLTGDTLKNRGTVTVRDILKTLPATALRKLA